MFFSNFGVAYTCRIVDVPASTGYGEPIQKQFKLKDGEKDRRRDEPRSAGVGPSKPVKEGADPADSGAPHALAVTSDGYALRFSLDPFVEVSTRAGRRYARPAKEPRSLASNSCAARKP